MADELQRLGVHQIETMARIDGGSEDKRGLHGGLALPRMGAELAGKLQRTLWIVFPKVDTVAELIVAVLALAEVTDFPLKYLLADLPVTPVKA